MGVSNTIADNADARRGARNRLQPDTIYPNPTCNRDENFGILENPTHMSYDVALGPTIHSIQIGI